MQLSGWQEIVLYSAAVITIWCFLAHCVLMPFCTCRKVPIKIRQSTFSHSTSQGWLLNGAHRGGGSERAENTTGAFKHSISRGLNFLECDVHLSKDG
jgi:hypothetical protein